MQKLRVIATGEELDIRTPYVEREVQITKLMRIPLYVAGVLKSAEELAELGLEIKEYTQEEVDAMECAALFAANPDLAKRVLEYKGYLDQLGINDYSANTDTIEEAVAISTTIEDKEAFVLRIKTAFDNIVLNLQAVNEDANAFTAWSKMPALVANLPAEPEPEPEQAEEPEQEQAEEPEQTESEPSVQAEQPEEPEEPEEPKESEAEQSEPEQPSEPAEGAE